MFGFTIVGFIATLGVWAAMRFSLNMPYDGIKIKHTGGEMPMLITAIEFKKGLARLMKMMIKDGTPRLSARRQSYEDMFARDL